MKFQPFKLSVSFVVPPAIPEYLHLDALIIRAIAEKNKLEDPLTLAGDVLAKDARTGIFLTSVHYIEKPEDRYLPPYGFYRRFALWEAVHHGIREKTKMQQGSGQDRAGAFKAYLLPAQSICFFGVGWPEEVKALVESLDCIGKHTRMGLGKIHEVSWEPLDDFPFLLNGAVTRYWPVGERLPDGRQPAGLRIYASPTPPYWAPDRQECFAPLPAHLRALKNQGGQGEGN